MEAQSCLYSWKNHASCLGGSMQSCFRGSKGGCFGVPCLAEEAEVCELYCLDLTPLQRDEKMSRFVDEEFHIEKDSSST